MVDFSSSVGYFKLYPVSDYDITNNSICIGWMNHKCLYFNPQNGEFVIEHQRYNYTPINDFNNEILVPVVTYLERQLILSERRHELLKKQEKILCVNILMNLLNIVIMKKILKFIHH